MRVEFRSDRCDGGMNLGDYAKSEDGLWYCLPPWKVVENDRMAGVGCLGDGVGNKGHKVVEHEDGTITVSPSILITDWKYGTWHGFLEHGVWREC